MKICDLTQFYSPRSGGVKRYIQEKIRFIQDSRREDDHVLIVPGEKNGVTEHEQSRVYTIRSPLVSRTTQYRALLNLRAVHDIIGRERPDILESSDPYQVGWEAVRIGRMQRIPVVGFYHSHFPEAYLCGPARRVSRRVSAGVMRAALAYARNLYNRYEATLVASPRLAAVLAEAGVRNTRSADLGVNLETFRPGRRPAHIREQLRIPAGCILLLYVGRLAAEKNTHTLFEAFSLLTQQCGSDFHLLVIGDGQQRDLLRNLALPIDQVTWLPYCADSGELARYYRSADLLVHPGLEETFGLVALESQACGTPVLGIRGSYMDDVICHDRNSWAAENSATALADAIETMSGRDLRKLGAMTAAAVAARYGWPRVLERLFCIYQEVCASYRKARPG